MSYNANMNAGNHTKNIALCGLFTALTAALTLLAVPIPGGTGFIHAGDGIIFFSLFILPFPYAMAVGGIGGMLADLFLAPVFAIPTLIIKPVMVLIARLIIGKGRSRNIFRMSLAFLTASLVMQIEYFLVDLVIFYEATEVAIGVALFGLIQTAVSVPLAVLLVRVAPKQLLIPKENP